MKAYDVFCNALAEFGKVLGQKLVLSEKDNTCSFVVDGDTAVNLTYLPNADEILAWSPVAGLPVDEHSEGRARRLLEMNDGWRETAGFTLALALDERHVIAHDHRSIRLFATADDIASWVAALVALVQGLRDQFEQRFPYWDDLPEDFPPEIAPISEGL